MLVKAYMFRVNSKTRISLLCILCFIIIVHLVSLSSLVLHNIYIKDCHRLIFTGNVVISLKESYTLHQIPYNFYPFFEKIDKLV